MFYKVALTVMGMCISASAVFAYNGNACSGKRKYKSSMKTTVASQLENNYDIKYLHFDIELTNTSTAVDGHVSIHTVTVNAMDTFAFELNNQLTIDSVVANGVKESIIVTNGSSRKVALSTACNASVPFVVTVYYHGQSTPGTGQFFTGGLNHAKLSSGTELMYSLSDPDFADDWWPCKQSLTDKIDSVDMWVTTTANLKVGSNGILKNITAMPGGKLRYEWKTNYPIEYYLISVAVSEYSEYSYYMHFTDGSNDSMLIQNFVYDSATYMTPANASALDSTGYIVDYFSKKFGRYPYYKEKYGHCIAETLSGGMEHQTMTTLAFAVTTLIAHELGHQWWGDNVTYTSWQDIWLSEGFASYCEDLFIEHFRGAAQAKSYRNSKFLSVMSSVGGAVYVDDTNNVNRVFDGRLTYNKGSAVAHMLRYMAPADSLYFKALQQYQQQFAYGNAITTDLKAIAEQVYNTDLDTFFNQWIYREGYPSYSAKWYQDGSMVYVQINQTTSKPSSVALFHMPLELKLKSANGDTIVKVYNSAATTTYPIPCSETMTGLEIDPNDHIVNRTGTITKDNSVLHIAQTLIDNIRIYPNPATDSWHIDQVPTGAKLVLSDVAGRVVWQSVAQNVIIDIPATQLAHGTYMLSIDFRGSISSQYKLTK